MAPLTKSLLESTTRELNDVRHALDQSAIVAITDRTGKIIHVNAKFCEISKYEREELIGQNHRIINSGHHSKEFFVEMWKAISSGKTWEGEIRNRAKDGSIYWVHTTIVPFLDNQQTPTQYVSIRYEITQRKLAEEQLRVYADRLELSNRELKDYAKKVLDREAQILMQDRLASIGLFASSLAHEIGTPLGVIRGRAEYLEIHAKEDPILKKNLHVIVSQIDRVSKLIRSLLNLARGDHMKSTTHVHLAEIVSEVIELMGHEFEKHHIEIRNELDSSLKIKVKAEAGPLHQVLINFLVNSVHAIESAIKGGRTSDHFVQISSQDLNDRWVLSISDSGCGISEENIKNLFKPFFTTKEIGVGTGLGLATSYSIIESWGGTVEVRSKEGQGTEFKVFIPKT